MEYILVFGIIYLLYGWIVASELAPRYMQRLEKRNIYEFNSLDIAICLVIYCIVIVLWLPLIFTIEDIK